MSQSTIAIHVDDKALSADATRVHQDIAEAGELLKEVFDADFALLDARTGDRLTTFTFLGGGNWELLAETVREVGRRECAEFIWESDPVLLLAIPLMNRFESPIVAVGLFATENLASDAPLQSLASELDLDIDNVVDWIRTQTPVPATLLLKTANLLVRQLTSDVRISELERETSQLAEEIVATYEEITLLHRLTHKLTISSDTIELGQESLKWLNEVIPAEGLALQLLSHSENESNRSRANSETRFIVRGDVPVDSEGFSRLVDHFGLDIQQQPLVLNHAITNVVHEAMPEIRELVVVPLTESGKLLGWLAAFNHDSDGEFGTVEANLLSSVATILGIHSGNIDLYRQQSELLAGIVQALTSAIDAKDPYTCGHSDRVARIAVRLGQELGYDQDTLKTIYMAGLLHDVGKIGISDQVLGKPGRLTLEEFEHIKTHVEVGYRILLDIKQLGDVLPFVRHHHESWNGTGYPHQLAGEDIPELARLAAVADAFDAMSSDRPYRLGMDDETIDAIFREGAGKQWDPRVVEAFFKIRDDIREISKSNSEHNVLAV